MGFKLTKAIRTLCFINNVFLKSFLVEQGQINVAIVSTYTLNNLPHENY